MTDSCRSNLWPLALGAALLLLGCEAPPEPPSPPEDLCASAWGPAPAAGRIHVDAAASAGGDGSLASPFATFAAGLAAARSSGLRQIVLAPGAYPGHHTLSGDDPTALDNDLEVVGCGRTQTTFQGVIEEQLIGGVPFQLLQPAFEIEGETTANITLRDFGVEGARRALLISGGAGADGAIVGLRLDLVDSVRVAVLVDGVTTRAELTDVLVDGVEPEDGAYGWGVAVQTNQWFGGDIAAPTTLSGVEVLGATEVGVLAQGAWVDLESVVVDGVQPQGGALGRGVQLQEFTRGTLSGVQSFGNSDAAVFLESPGRPQAGGGIDAIELLGCVLGPTLAADIGGNATAADGLAITQYVPVGPPAAAENFRVVLDDSELTGNSRLHALVERVTLEVGPNNVFGKGAGYPLAAQDGAVVTGLGGGPPGVAPALLGEPGGDPALELRRDPLLPDAPEG